MIDYEAALKEYADNVGHGNIPNLLAIYKKHTILPGQPLSPRLAWLALSQGEEIGLGDFQCYLSTSGLLANRGITPSIDFYQQLVSVMQSGKATIVEK
jgi:hypothetical protein